MSRRGESTSSSSGPTSAGTSCSCSGQLRHVSASSCAADSRGSGAAEVGVSVSGSGETARAAARRKKLIQSSLSNVVWSRSAAAAWARVACSVDTMARLKAAQSGGRLRVLRALETRQTSPCSHLGLVRSSVSTVSTLPGSPSHSSCAPGAGSALVTRSRVPSSAAVSGAAAGAASSSCSAITATASGDSTISTSRLR